MNRIVLDASDLLAILNQEPGADRLTPELLSAASSNVNLAEAQGTSDDTSSAQSSSERTEPRGRYACSAIERGESRDSAATRIRRCE